MLSSLLSMLRKGDPEIDLHAVEFAAQAESTPNAVLVDVRTSPEFSQGHIPGAVLLDISRPDFHKKLEAMDRSAPYFVYCASGSRSSHAVRMMKSMDFAHVRNLAGGIMTWRGKITR